MMGEKRTGLLEFGACCPSFPVLVNTEFSFSVAIGGYGDIKGLFYGPFRIQHNELIGISCNYRHIASPTSLTCFCSQRVKATT